MVCLGWGMIGRGGDIGNGGEGREGGRGADWVWEGKNAKERRSLGNGGEGM